MHADLVLGRHVALVNENETMLHGSKTRLPFPRMQAGADQRALGVDAVRSVGADGRVESARVSRASHCPRAPRRPEVHLYYIYIYTHTHTYIHPLSHTPTPHF
jgi:hypothetical protein